MKSNSISSQSARADAGTLFRLKKLTSKIPESSTISLESIVAASGDQISCDLEGEAAS